MCANTRHSIVIMCWSSRLPAGRKVPGRITEAILRRQLPPPGPDTVIFLCGPPRMVDTLEATLKGIGYSEQSIVLP